MWLWILLAVVLLAVLYFLYILDADLTLLTCQDNLGSFYRNKVVWVTGASSGLGESLAYLLAQEQAKLVLSGTNTTHLEMVKQACLEKGNLTDADVLVLPFNIADFSAHENCVNLVLRHFKKIDILVNNAGRSQRAIFENITPTVDKTMFDINVFGPVNLTRKVLLHFKERNVGQIAVTSSITGKLGYPGSATYTGGKHALHGYFECLRSELCETNIKITMLCPGPTFSAVVERAFTGEIDKVHGEKQKSTDKRLETDRCARLMARAIANQLDEAWISLQPLLTMFYLAQYIPSIFRNHLIKRYFNQESAACLREGR